MKVPQWFDEVRFGLFFHWGHSSQRGCELSWPMVGGNFALPKCAPLPVGEYQSTAGTFNPAAYDPAEWARLARECGAEYAVLTAKHHDGYAMFNTALSDFSVRASGFGRDIVGEFAEAFRSAGLRVGLYFSLADWHHPDYPPFTDANRPYIPPNWPQPTPQQWRRYIDFMFGQVRELLTNYGRIDLLWFDGQWERTQEQWRANELATMIRDLQPEIVINDRLPGAGDYDTPEQFVPPHAPERPWEVCLTMNDSWGYNPTDTDYKSARDLVHTLSEIAGKGGRLLLNVSPMGEGTLPPKQVERLREVGSWLRKYGAAIHGTEAGLAPWQFYGPSTRIDSEIYLHLLMRPYDSVTLRGVPIRRVIAVRDLGTGRELPFGSRCAVLDQLLNSDPEGELTVYVPEDILDPLATVLQVQIRRP